MQPPHAEGCIVCPHLVTAPRTSRRRTVQGVSIEKGCCRTPTQLFKNFSAATEQGQRCISCAHESTSFRPLHILASFRGIIGIRRQGLAWAETWFSAALSAFLSAGLSRRLQSGRCAPAACFLHSYHYVNVPADRRPALARESGHWLAATGACVVLLGGSRSAAEPTA